MNSAKEKYWICFFLGINLRKWMWGLLILTASFTTYQIQMETALKLWYAHWIICWISMIKKKPQFILAVENIHYKSWPFKCAQLKDFMVVQKICCSLSESGVDCQVPLHYEQLGPILTLWLHLVGLSATDKLKGFPISENIRTARRLVIKHYSFNQKQHYVPFC